MPKTTRSTKLDQESSVLNMVSMSRSSFMTWLHRGLMPMQMRDPIFHHHCDHH